jgi:hypothetical protein
MPSRSTPVTLEFRYCRVGAPCGGASAGIAAIGSGCCEAARDDTSGPFSRRTGVPVLGGTGLGAFAAVEAI